MSTFVSLNDVMGNIVKELPELGVPQLEPHVRRIVSIYLENAKSGDTLADPAAKQAALQQAVRDLVLYNLDPAGLDALLNKLDQVLDQLAIKSVLEFKDSAGVQLNEDGANLAAVYEKKAQEQAGLEAFVATTKKDWREVVDALGWQSLFKKPDAPVPAEPIAPKQRSSLLQALQDKLVARMMEQSAQPAPVSEPEPLTPAVDTHASWTTKSVFRPDDPTLVRPLYILSLAVGYVREYGKDPALKPQMQKLILDRMANKTIGEEELLLTLKTLWDLADQQDLLSDYVVANVTASVTARRAKFETITMVRMIIDTTRNFFTPAITSAKKTAASAAR